MISGQHANVSGHPVALWLELDLDAQPIKGTLAPPRGPSVPFVGWLGLTAALEGLRGAHEPPVREKAE